jgi:lysyl-tRNA synthetase class 2
MEGERPADLRQARLRKLEELRAAGAEPFALRFDRTHSVAEGLELFNQLSGKADDARSDPVRVAGRVLRHRSQGKAGFADLVDETGKLQLYAHTDTLGAEGMERFNQLDLGDIVGVEGPIFRTRRGEVSLDIQRLELLTKSLRPLPDKWHGLRDPELRFRRRHLDLIANPDAQRALRLRSRLISHVRRYLDDRGFVEVETPVLHRIPGGAAARPFATHHNALDMDLYLRIALELHLKRLVVGGFERVYEIGRVFRNEGVDATHNPEFTMLELYQAWTDHRGMMELTRGLIQSAASALLGGERLTYQGEEVDLSGEWAAREMLELVAAANKGVDLENVDPMRKRAVELGAVLAEGMDWGQLLFELFERSVEPTLRAPTFVTGFPISVSPLARQRSDDPRLAERFELFIAGQELANAFSELTDPIDQRRRFEEQARQRAAGAEETHPMDEDFLAALEQGMPPTGGLGIGIDRLAMVFADVAHIREVLSFPLMRPPAPGAIEDED